LGRPAVVPPAGRGWGARPCGGAGRGKVGAFFESAWVGCGRLGDPALPGGRRVRWGWPEDSIPIGRWQPLWRSESYLGDAGSGPSV
jgi:hypothetical protein